MRKLLLVVRALGAVVVTAIMIWPVAVEIVLLDYMGIAPRHLYVSRVYFWLMERLQPDFLTDY